MAGSLDSFNAERFTLASLPASNRQGPVFFQRALGNGPAPCLEEGPKVFAGGFGEADHEVLPLFIIGAGALGTGKRFVSGKHLKEPDPGRGKNSWVLQRQLLRRRAGCAL